MTETNTHFRLVILGCSGGPFEGNLSGYLISPIQDPSFILIDGGTLLTGLQIALQKGALKDLKLEDRHLKPEGVFFHHHLKAYFISHAHLDHISALVINSQVDKSKPIFAFDHTIDYLRDHIFNGKIWPNYGNEGNSPQLGLYHYERLRPEKRISVPGTSLSVEPFILNHTPLTPSAAFLIEHQGHYLLYFGDTISDKMAKDEKMHRVWKHVAPLIRKRKLSGVFLECSYPLSRAEGARHGHLSPQLVHEELDRLCEEVQGDLDHLKFMIIHRKEPLEKDQDMLGQIEKELTAKNPWKVNWIFPLQGDELFI